MPYTPIVGYSYAIGLFEELGFHVPTSTVLGFCAELLA